MSPSIGGRLMRVFSRTISGAAAIMSEVSKAPAWSPARKASPSVSAQRFFVTSVKQTLVPAFFASSTAFFSASMCWGSRWMFTRDTARNFLARVRQRSRTSTCAVSAGRLIVPGKSAPNSATVKVTGGRIRAAIPRSFSLSAPRRAISVAITESVETGRWGPWASVAPTGSRATGRSFIAWSTSVQVISDINTLSAMVLEGSVFLRSFLLFLISGVGGGNSRSRSLYSIGSARASLRRAFVQPAVGAPVIEQGPARRDPELQHLAHPDRVVPLGGARLHPAFEVGEGVRHQQGPLDPGEQLGVPDLLGPPGGEAARPGLLALVEHAHSEEARGLQGPVHLGAMVHAHQDQGGIEADRAERARGEARGPARGVPRGHHRDAARELPEGLAEREGIDGHHHLRRPGRAGGRARPGWPTGRGAGRRGQGLGPGREPGTGA